MSDVTADMSLQESCKDAARHMSVEVHLLAAKADGLEQENAKLREELESVGTAAYLYGRSDLKAENAKLRELCEDMLSCIEIRAAWHRPPTEEMYEEFAQRARELGMEVD